MENDCGRGGYADGNANQEACRDSDAVEKIVKRIPDDGEVHHGMYFFFMGTVRMVPYKKTFQHEEQHDAGEHITAVSQSRFVGHNLRENVDEHIAEKRAGGKAHEIKRMRWRRSCLMLRAKMPIREMRLTATTLISVYIQI